MVMFICNPIQHKKAPTEQYIYTPSRVTELLELTPCTRLVLRSSNTLGFSEFAGENGGKP